MISIITGRQEKRDAGWLVDGATVIPDEFWVGEVAVGMRCAGGPSESGRFIFVALPL